MTYKSSTPTVDIVEQEAGYLLYLDMPGVKKENLSIAVERDTLSIKGNYKENEKKPVFSYQEYKGRNYSRNFKLSPDVDRSNIDANLEDGVLTLTLQKMKESLAKQITIN